MSGTHGFDALAARVGNWGRWGDADQRGTLNLIDAAALRRAAAAVRSGKAFSLSLDFARHGPQPSGGERVNPQLFVTQLGTPLDPRDPRWRYCDDLLLLSPQASTQWDSLAHVFYDGLLYNGVPVEDALTSAGAMIGGVEHIARTGVVARGLLLDIAGLHSVDRLSRSDGVTVADLDAACAAQGVVVEPGDVVVVRTGHIRHLCADEDRTGFAGTQPGVVPDVAEWLADHGVAAIAADNSAVERVAGDVSSGVALPLHMLALRDMGMPLGELFMLEELAADCARDGQYTFMLSAPALPIVGAFGSPVNPIAIK